MNQSLLKLAARLACVALVVSVVFPLGRILFPYVGGFIWIVKMQGALNDYWRSKQSGAATAAAAQPA